MLILVDSSVWVSLLGKSSRFQITNEQLETVATCPPIIQEVCQGIRDEIVRESIKDRFLALRRIGDPVDLELYLMASDIYYTGRRKGLTIRSSIDSLIAAIALRHNAIIWHFDRDFELIAKFTALKTITKSSI